MRSWTDILCWVVGLIAFAFAIWQFLLFVSNKDARGFTDLAGGLNHLWLSLAAAVVACACGVALFVRRPHVEEEIHITEK